MVRRRLAANGLARPVAATPERVVSSLLAVQSQDVQPSAWSVAQRLIGGTEAEVERARAEIADLHSGDLAATAVEWDRAADPDARTGYRSWLVVQRGDVRVVVNLAEQPATVPVPGAGRLGVLAAWDPATVADDAVDLPGRSVVVLGAGHHAGAV